MSRTSCRSLSSEFCILKARHYQLNIPRLQHAILAVIDRLCADRRSLKDLRLSNCIRKSDMVQKQAGSDIHTNVL
jgi:hypothetical protein